MIKSFAFTKIIVSDLAALEAFYVESLGFSIVTRISVDTAGSEMDEVILSAGDGAMLNLVQFRYRPCPEVGEAVIGLYVDHIEQMVEAAVNGGAVVTVPVLHLPDSKLKLAYFTDPQGHLVELLEMDQP